jgi:hypothetical protein
MAFISILKSPDSEALRIVASEERLVPERPPGPDGTFSGGPDAVAFQREVPSPEALLNRLQELLASSRVESSEDTFLCPVPIAIRAIEVAFADLWPTRRLRCPECQKYFVVPYAERRHMYITCPHCNNPLLNPSWDSA